MKERLRKSGIDIIGDVPWGTHFCQFYQTKEDVIEILVPYFKAGLENNEFCLCVLSQPLEVEDAKEALRRAIPDLNTYQEKGQFEIVPFQGEFITRGIFDSEKAYSYWVEILNHSLDSGHDGLRFGGIISRTDKEDWNLLLEYEKQIDNFIDNYQMIALCTYSLNRYSATEIIDVVANHQFALVKKEGEWERIDYSGRKNINERKKTAELLSQSEQRFRLKSEEPLLPSLEIANLELADIVDVQAIQSLMDDFYNLVHIPIGLNNLKGNVLAGAGWQDICTRFHRIHPEASKHCIESAIKFSSGVLLGEFKLYKCENNMWDVATPIMVGGRQAGVIFLGQFFLEDDLLDYESFKSQARQYGFNEEEYLAALEKVPRLSRENVEKSTTFLTKLANIISQQSYSNLKLARSLAERDSLVDALQESDERFRSVLENSLDSAYRLDLQNNCFDYMSPVIKKTTGFSVKEIKAMTRSDLLDRIHPDDRPLVIAGIPKALDEGFGTHEYRFKCKDGKYRWLADYFAIIKDKTGMLRFRAGIVRDITERKKAEEMLQVSEARYRSLYENSLDGILLTKPDGTILSANPEACHMFGMTEDEIKQVGREGVVVNDEKLATALEERKQTGRMRAELAHRRKDGSTFVCDTTSQLFIDADGSTSTSLIIRDVTERKRAEEKVQSARNMLQLIMDNIPQGIFWKDRNSRYMGCNKVFAEATGLESPESIVGKTDYDLPWLPEQTKWFREYDCKVMENDTPEYYIVEPQQEADGKLAWIETSKIPLHDAKGNVIGILGTYEDITERKKAEEALRLSNLYNRSLIEASLDPLVTIGRDGKITDVNGATEQVTGYSRSELIGTDFSDYFTEPQKARAGYKQAFMDSEVRDYPLEIQHKEGHITSVLYNASVYRDENGKIIGVFAAARDITESIKAKEKIQTLANAVESSDDAIITKSLDGIITSWNMGAEKVYGYSAEEVVGKPISILEPDGRKGEIKLFSEKINQGEKVQHYETTRLKKDGAIISVSVTLSPIFDSSGKLVAISTIGRDITERKRADEALRLSNLYNRSLIESSLDPLVTIGPDGKITDVNAATEIATGYSRDELIGTDFSDYFTDPEKAKKGYQQVFKEGSVFDYELEIQNRNGSIIPVLYNASVYKEESGKVIGVFAAARDITESKKAEKALKKAYDSLEEKVKERTAELEEAYKSLKESEKGLAEAQRMAHIGNWEWDLLTGRMRWSNELYHIFGRSPQKAAPLINEFLDYIHPDDREYVENSIQNGLKEESKSGIDYRVILANGEERTVHSQAEVIFNQKNIPVRVKGIVQDITERKKTEEKIQVLVNAVESSNDAIITFSLEGIVTSWNKGAEQIYGYSAEEIVGKNISITEPNSLKGEIKYFSENIKQGEKSQSYETLRLKKDGTTINISAALSPVFNASGELVAILAIARDITERVKTEKAMAEIDKIRIKEIHHRIKNNLQVISSLLDLQAERFRNKEVLEAFRESQNRVTSMSLIHEELYKGERNDTLNFSVYLQKLAESLFQTYSLKSKNVHLFTDLEENTLFDMDVAVPLGIIVNELVSNSLKHAFTGEKEGEIRIKLCREEQVNEMHKSFFSLTISDNGTGIPEGIKLESLESLGLQLVNILVDQLDGNIELNRANGTEFRITFNVAEKS